MDHPVIANTASEALDLLDAAKHRIESQLLMLYPGMNTGDRLRASRTTPLRLTLQVEETETATLIQQEHTLRADARDLDT